ncbi:Protein MAIN-LIKE 1 [Glycine max]|nr:Protein MAIN-LIKE 1 [Glycine max]
MVRTRGLGLALGRVVNRGLGKGDRDDSDGAPQRRRPTVSAHRHRVLVTVTDDEPMVPSDSPVVPATEPAVSADEPMVDAHVQDTGVDIGAGTDAEAAANDLEGFPGGLIDPSMLTEYAEHVAASVWTGEERPEFKLSSHGRKVQKLGRPVLDIKGLVAGTGLSPLIACSVDTSDQGLISSFVERWHRETSSFHLPVGEVTITLDDMASLLHLPIIGKFHSFQPLHVNETVLMLVDLLLISPEAARAKTGHCYGPYIRLSWLQDMYQRGCQAGHWTAVARAYLLHLLGCTLFSNKSATHVHVVFLDALLDLSQSGRYAWGAATLCWIYEHFLLVAECNADPKYNEASPRACQSIVTKKIVKSISTETYRQHLD